MILGRKISKIVHYDFKSVQFWISLIIVNVYILGMANKDLRHFLQSSGDFRSVIIDF